MSEHTATLDYVVRIILRPEILRVYWSTTKTWPGNTVRLCVETRNVPDGTKVDFEVYSTRLGREGPLVHAESGAFIEHSRCVIDHEIAWKPEPLVEVFEQRDLDCLFTLHASIERYGLSASSAPLYVALDPIVPSF